MRELKFRIWDDKLKTFSYFDLFSAFGRVPEDCRENVQQFTGFLDKNGKEIYEGDMVKFFYRAGDFALMEMTPEEYEYEKSIQKEYIGVISPICSRPTNLEIIVGSPESTHMIFPLSYAGNSEIVGNIFENYGK